MTATSHARGRFMRLSSMETLGFIDPPDASWTTTPTLPDPGSAIESAQTTELFEIPIGRHTRRVEPTGELVKDMWDSTELHAPSLLDWAPQTFNSTKLGRRNFRWPVLLSVLVVVAAIAGAGYWIYSQPDNAAASALTLVESEATNLAATFEQAAPLIADLDEDRFSEESQSSAVFFEMGEAARAMFAASADLPGSASSDRSAAADAAALAIDSSRRLMDATAYRSALEPALTLPLLETDPALTDLVTATAAFSEWRSGFESVHEALPSEVTGEASAALDALGTGLESTQSAYLDALRTEDRAAAVEAIGNLRAELQQVRHVLLVDMSEISVSVSALIEQAEAILDQLVG